MHTFQEMLIPDDFREAENLLRQSGLEMPEGVTWGLGAYAGPALAGAGFLAGNVACGICVAEPERGTGLASAIVSRLVGRALESGLTRLMLFTKPDEAGKFADIGFKELMATDSAALLEWGRPDYADWLGRVKAELAAHASRAGAGGGPGADEENPDGAEPHSENSRGADPRSANPDDSNPDGVEPLFALGAVVMNANPFTLGHRHLVLRALARCRRAAVFVVEEEASSFPFAVRLDLARRGLADQPRAIVLPGGPYIVSRASFPSYFTGKAEHSRVHAGLDCAMFAARIAADLGISARFVGEEPYCPVTAGYNAIMRAILPRYGVQCLEAPRLTADKTPISASAVRALMRGEKTAQELERLVPASTAAFINSPEARGVAEALRKGAGRH